MKILAISTHPDDETLGCGGTLLKHREQGDDLHWLIVTQTHAPQWSEAVVAQKSTEVDAVAEAYGMREVFRLGCPATSMDTVREADLIDRIRQVVQQVKPETIYLVHGGDVHSDHRAVFDATLAVLKPFYMKKLGVRRILSFETLSSTEAAAPLIRQPFIPTVFSDISGHLEAKVAIMRLFSSEIHTDPSPRGPSAIAALARYRGATIGVEHAEALMLIREVC